MKKLLLIIPLIAISACTNLLLTASPTYAYTPDAQGGRDFANVFCSDPTYREDKIADVMWITAPGGGSTITVVDGQNQNVNVEVHFFVTYCRDWPQGYANGATSLQAINGAGNKLRNASGSVGYPDKSTPRGVRSEQVPAVTGAQLDLTGLSGNQQFCTRFATISTRPGVIPSDSPNICFDLTINRIYPWTTSGSSLVGVDHDPNVPNWTAAPGNTLYWRHTIQNTGQGSTPGLGFGINRSGFNGPNVWADGSAANHNKPVATTTPIGSGGSYQVGFQRNAPAYSVYRVVDSDLGGRLCQGISWGPSAYNNNAWSAGAPACVDIPYNFNLTPTMSVPTTSLPPGDATISSITPSITNAGPTASYPNTPWKVVRFVLAPGVARPVTSTGGVQAPCAYYGNGCTDTFDSPRNDGTGQFSAGSTPLPALTDNNVTGLVPGAQVCYALSVRGYDVAHNPASANEWRYGTPTCIKVAKKPNIQVWGGDLRSRGNIATSVATLGGAQFGSWVEYGALSLGGNTNFASGSGFSGGSTASVAQRNMLTFANRGGTYGSYTLPAKPALVAQFKAMTPKQGMGPSNFSGYNSGVYQTTSDITVAASTIGQDASGNGKTIVVITSGTATITGDVMYSGPGAGNSFTNVKQIPQFILIAKTINIRANVNEVNAWLLADTAGVINTCSNVAPTASLSTAICGAKLTVNGPVATDTLYLRRTAGASSVATANDPAEVFNLRADAYLWGYGTTAQSGRVQTDQVTEAPPRF